MAGSEGEPAWRAAPSEVRSGGRLWCCLREGAAVGAIALLTAVLVLLLLDWLLFEGPVAGRLPLGNNDGSPNDKLLLAGRYPDAEVLYLGDSRIFFGVDPATVSEVCGCGPGFNGGVPAADLRLTRILAGELLEELSPRLVVLGVSQWELSDEADIRLEEPARELVAPGQFAEFGVTLDGPKRIDELLDEVWQLHRYRHEVRAALDAWANGGPEDPRRGFRVYHEQRRLSRRDMSRREQQWFDDFSVTGRRAEALRGLVADLRRRGVRVLLVAPPLYPDFHADVRREVAVFRSGMAGLAAEQGVAFEDLTEPQRIGVGPEHFKDVVHLDADGAAAFSRGVGKALRARIDTN